MTIVQEQKILKASSNINIFCELFLTTNSLQALKYSLNIPFYICVAYNLKSLQTQCFQAVFGYIGM